MTKGDFAIFHNDRGGAVVREPVVVCWDMGKMVCFHRYRNSLAVDVQPSESVTLSSDEDWKETAGRIDRLLEATEWTEDDSRFMASHGYMEQK